LYGYRFARLIHHLPHCDTDKLAAASSLSAWTLAHHLTFLSPRHWLIYAYNQVLFSCAMDPLSVTASIIAVLQLCGKVLEYLNDVKDASKDRAQCAIEAANVYNLLTNLRYRLETGNASQQPWYNAVRALAVEKGPLDQFKQVLEMLQAKTTDRGRLKLGEALIWKFKKAEIANILARIDRLKTLVGFALQTDNL
jgi:hypothetical protein